MLHKYPYTDLHEINLDYVLSEVKRVTEEWIAYKKAADAKFDSIEAAFKDLKDYVINYFDKTDFRQLVADEIEKYIDDGTIAAMVTGEINLEVALHLNRGTEENINLNNRIVNYMKANPGRTFYMPEGEWYVDTYIYIDRDFGTILHSDDGCVYKTHGINEMFVFSNQLGTNDQTRLTGLDGGTIDASHVNNAVIAVRWHTLIVNIKNIRIENLENNCIGICIGTMKNYVTRQEVTLDNPNTQTYVSNVQITGRNKDENDNYVMNGSGLYVMGTDGYFDNVGVVNCKHGFEAITGGNKLVNIHIATDTRAYPEGLEPTELVQYYAIGARGGQFDNVQIDNYYVGFRVWSTYYPYDVKIDNYIFNTGDKDRTGTFINYTRDAGSLCSAIYEIPNDYTNSYAGNRIQYDVRIVRDILGCIHTKYIELPANKYIASYPYLYNNFGNKKDTSFITRDSARFMPLIDDAFKVVSGDCFDLTSNYNYRRTTYSLIGYVSGAYNNIADFNIHLFNGDVNVKIITGSNGPQEINTNVINAINPQCKIAIDTVNYRTFEGTKYYPVYLAFNAAGGNISGCFTITANSIYMPNGFYLTKGKALYNQYGVTETWEVESIASKIEANLY